jgi:hypothetical protein
MIAQGKSSPPRTNVRGAEHPSFDVAEDEDNPGLIEAGLLVEKCWLGSPHELALNNGRCYILSHPSFPIVNV